MKYSKLAESIPASPIRDMMVRAAAMEDVISFAVGEPDFTPSEQVIDAAKTALDKRDTKYAPGAGITELREVYADYVSQMTGVHYDVSNVIVTAGGMASETFSYMCSLFPGVETFVGIKNDELGSGANHHTPEFDLDEEGLTYGAAAAVGYVLEYTKMLRPLGSGTTDLQDKIFAVQECVLQDFADKGPCTMVGRCSDYLMRDRQDLLRVYIYSPLDARIRNCVQYFGMTEEKGRKMCMDVDKARKAYHKH